MGTPMRLGARQGDDKKAGVASLVNDSCSWPRESDLQLAFWVHSF